MTRELVKGQNMPWPGGGLRVEVTGASCDLSALRVGDDHLVRGSDDVVLSHQPGAEGVTWVGEPVQRLDIDLARVPTARVLCLVSVDPDSPPLGRHGTLRAVLADDRGPVAAFDLSGLTTERAAVVCEVYRRDGAWKVRAVSQGYDGGLAEALVRHGVEVDDAPVAAGTGSADRAAPPAPAAPAAPVPQVGASQAAPPPGTSDEDRLYRQAAAIFEDAARSTASLRSSVDFAEQRRDAELASAVADPRQRSRALTGAGSGSAAAEAQRRYDELVTTARANHRRDVAQLREELQEHLRRLPAAMAPWASPAWRGWQPPPRRCPAVHVGDLHVAEAPDLLLPMLVRVPLGAPLWVDTGGDDGAGARMLRALTTRLLAACPAGTLTLTVVDLGGDATTALAPLGRPGCSVLREPPATTPAAAHAALDVLARRVDLLQMAAAAGALDAVPEAGDRLVVLHGFPFGFDDAALARVRYLADEGATVGLQLLLTGERSRAVDDGPLVSSVLRAALRLPVRPDDHIADGWTGTGWTYTPDLGPPDAQVLSSVLDRASAS